MSAAETLVQSIHNVGGDSPRLDVVILSWQRVEMTLETIANVLAQDGVMVDIWIVDQGSDESTLSQLRGVAAEHTNCHLIELGRNTGVPGGRNIGMRLGCAPWIVIVDNDAEFESPNAFKMVVDRFQQDNSLAVIGFRVRNFYTGLDDELSWAYPAGLKAQRNEEFVTTRFAGGAHAIRRDAFNVTEGYDDSLFFYWEELELSYQLINKGYRIIYFPAVVLRHKVSPEARVQWQGGRFYYLVRNAIYIRFKGSRAILQCLTLAAGYFVKGIVNKVAGQALRGIWHAIPMCWRSDPAMKLTPQAIEYISRFETKHRGRIVTRIQREVFARLPGR